MFEFKIDKIDNIQIYDSKLMKIEECNINNTVITTEVEPYSLSKEKLSFSHEATFEASDVNFSSLLPDSTFGNKPFNLEYSIPIMIQSRWHKKKRINKKWLKRYGMKKDSILVKCDVESISPNTDYNFNHNQYCLPECVEFDMTLNNMEYKYRPDQLRRGLKIEV